ncbi:Tctex1 domain-containing protein 3 [Taenia crassiceps]|uniref:Tctex1 domain-containing protein 3 n=1 Tax=Taenia crassiceps TaxID=6207 RepID=A0ABR4Q3L6_9CEST
MASKEIVLFLQLQICVLLCCIEIWKKGKDTLQPKRTHSSAVVNGSKRKGRERTGSKKRPLDIDKQYAVNKDELDKKQLQQGDQQLSFLGVLVAQSALRRFLAPHKGLLSKLNFRRFSRLSTGADSLFFLPPQMAPTYQLGPLKPFITHRVLPVIQEVVIGIIDHTIQNVDEMSIEGLAKNISNDVRVAVRSLGLPRFKYVVYTAVTKDIGQSMLSVSRVLWNPEFDRQVSIKHFRDKHVIHVTVFACYHD